MPTRRAKPAHPSKPPRALSHTRVGRPCCARCRPARYAQRRPCRRSVLRPMSGTPLSWHHSWLISCRMGPFPTAGGRASLACRWTRRRPTCCPWRRACMPWSWHRCCGRTPACVTCTRVRGLLCHAAPCCATLCCAVSRRDAPVPIRAAAPPCLVPAPVPPPTHTPARAPPPADLFQALQQRAGQIELSWRVSMRRSTASPARLLPRRPPAGFQCAAATARSPEVGASCARAELESSQPSGCGFSAEQGRWEQQAG